MAINMENQVLSIEQMDHLKELGVDTSGASMVYLTYKDTTDEWIECDDIVSSHFKFDESSHPITTLDVNNDKIMLWHNMSEISNYSCCKIEPTFTLQDMIDLMPKDLDHSTELRIGLHDNSFFYLEVCGWEEDELVIKFASDKLLTSAYEMLCWLAENDYLTNKRYG